MNNKFQHPLDKEVTYDELLSVVDNNPFLKELVVPKNITSIYGFPENTPITWGVLVEECPVGKEKEVLINLESLIEKRKETEWNFFNIPAKFLPEARKGVEAIEGLRYNKKLEIGRGAAGVVFVHDEKLDICVKYLHDPNKSKNTLSQEFSLLGKASKIKFKKLKIPKPDVFIPNRNPLKSIFTMERVHGINVEQIEADPTSFLKLVNGNKEKLEEIIEELKKETDIYADDIETLHKNKIIHADLHVRNVMLDEEGNLYLIDFGNSIDENNPSSEYAKAEDIYESTENIKEQGRDSIKNIIKILIKSLEKSLLTDLTI